MKEHELLQQALDVIKDATEQIESEWSYDYKDGREVIVALEAELAKTEPRNDAAWYWHDLYKAKCEEIEFGFAITPSPKLANPEQYHGFDRTASHMAGDYVDTKQQNVNTSEERVQKSDRNAHEPVSEVVSYSHAGMYEVLPLGTLLYTSPPRKEWNGLTVDEIDDCFRENENVMGNIYRAIEVKLRSKNGH